MKAAASKKRVSEPVSASKQDRRCLGPAGDAGGGTSATCGAEPTPNISLLLPGRVPLQRPRVRERAQEWHCQFPRDSPCREGHHSCTSPWAALAPAMVGNPLCQRQPLCPSPALSPGGPVISSTVLLGACVTPPSLPHQRCS